MKRLGQFDTYSIDVTKVFVDGDFNCRGYFTLESVSDLANSIKEHGLQMPVIVQPYQHEKYEFRLIAGYRRFTACTRFLKWTDIPAQVRTDLTEQQARVLNLTENLERCGLNLLEEARAIAHTFPDMSLRKIAAAINRPVRWVYARKQLLKMPEEVQQMAAAGWLNQWNLVILSQLTSPEDQIEGARRMTAVKQANKRSMTHLPAKFQSRYKQSRTKEQVYKMVARMLDAGIEGGMPRVALWCVGKLTDAELDEDIKERLREQEKLQTADD